ncbi:MAG: ABC transporter permease [Propionibacteriales bacterium]|nr:ABC transporter permease [Propionibacteriales bacterium]
MIGALRYEWVRIRTIASSYWMTALAIVLSVAVALLIALLTNVNEMQDLDVVQFTSWVITAGASFSGIPVLASAFFAVMGAMAMGHEYRYGTNKATLTALPDRIAVYAAKSVVLVTWVSAAVAGILLIDAAVAALFLSHPHFSTDAIRPLLNYWGYCVGFALAGLSLAAIFRNQTGAIVAVLVWPYVIEPITYGVLGAIGQRSSHTLGTLTNLLPTSAGRRSIFDPYDLMAGYGVFDTWGVGASTLVFWVAVLSVVGGGVASFVLRDA